MYSDISWLNLDISFLGLFQYVAAKREKKMERSSVVEKSLIYWLTGSNAVVFENGEHDWRTSSRESLSSTLQVLIRNYCKES